MDRQARLHAETRRLSEFDPPPRPASPDPCGSGGRERAELALQRALDDLSRPDTGCLSADDRSSGAARRPMKASGRPEGYRTVRGHRCPRSAGAGDDRLVDRA
jgi:hypothetical protein